MHIIEEDKDVKQDNQVINDDNEVNTLDDEENKVYDMAQSWMVESMGTENDITIEQVSKSSHHT